MADFSFTGQKEIVLTGIALRVVCKRNIMVMQDSLGFLILLPTPSYVLRELIFFALISSFRGSNICSSCIHHFKHVFKL